MRALALMFLSLAVATIAAFAIAVIYYLAPSSHLSRGTGALIALFVGLGVSAGVLLFDKTRKAPRQ